MVIKVVFYFIPSLFPIDIFVVPKKQTVAEKRKESRLSRVQLFVTIDYSFTSFRSGDLARVTEWLYISSSRIFPPRV